MKIHKLVRAVTFLLLVIAVVVSAYIFVQFSFLGKDLTESALNVGYMGIFLFSMLLDLSFQLIGPDVLLLAGTSSRFNIYYVTLAIALGTTVAGFIGYTIGRVYGEPALKFFMNEKHYHKSLHFFRKYGKITMTLLAISPLPYFPILGGIFELTLKEFVLYAIIPRVLRFTMGAYIITLLI